MTKILYVEDEPFLGKIVKESLESRNFEVNMVTDGNLVLKAFEQFKPDICVFDVMLPNKDGYTLGNEIRQIKPALPIIFLTAKTQTDDVLKGFQSGGNDYIRKPFSMEELIVRINNLLLLSNSKGITPTGSIALGKYEFLPQKYELRLNEHCRKLSHRETELLKIFTENRNYTVNRKEILMKIWGDDSFFNSRNLDVYITKLRDYLKEDETLELMTIKGVGYHFTTPMA
ncbi:response regulator transcription factor [Emticicia sp. BO119]|uniref:response regulator transcription factor n=1 Tax=Emticicia sp. BO119 TaxID=2757768 RepID=UPI0015EFDF33|nr:response regulator transcription factor [Emticicia sp. BO119]MBA4852144.1 response regulator transcription factor [Emticicia sp. BO119]